MKPALEQELRSIAAELAEKAFNQLNNASQGVVQIARDNHQGTTEQELVKESDILAFLQDETARQLQYRIARARVVRDQTLRAYTTFQMPDNASSPTWKRSLSRRGKEAPISAS